MSFIEFDPKKFNPEIDGPFDLQTSVTRQAWNILASFAKADEHEVNLSQFDMDYVALSTDAIDPLKKGQLVRFDQMPVINDEVVLETGLFAMKVLRPTDEKLLRQIIFRLETHIEGVAVFYDRVSDETMVTNEEELLLSIKLEQIQDAYWCVASELEASLMGQFPVSSGVLAVEAFLEAQSD